MSIGPKILATSMMALAASLTLQSAGIAAEQLSAEDIIRALKPPRVTRGLTASPAEAATNAEQSKFIDGLRNRATRSLSNDEREKIVSIAKSKPSIDLEINFDYNSATIGNKAAPQVTALGQALSSADLKGSTFILAGHTDAKGGDTYNQGLSERRADAVKNYLLQKYGIDGGHLVTAGYGKSQLKNTGTPYSAENRRVQIINIADK
ncbi:MAG: OmpA family protein [Hyphomicrobiales bacterium]|nr:OmpA family protein [Hyphomicrobiales bacterium]